MAESQSFWDSKAIKVIGGIVIIVTLVEILNKVFGKSDEQKRKDANMKKSSDARAKLYREVPPSYSDNAYEDFADAIHSALASELYEDEAAAFAVFRKMKNISDVNKLIEFYGHNRVAGTLLYLSLPALISRVFNASEKATLNKILKDRRINYKFN